MYKMTKTKTKEVEPEQLDFKLFVNRINIVLQSLEGAQSKGAFTLDDAALLSLVRREIVNDLNLLAKEKGVELNVTE